MAGRGWVWSRQLSQGNVPFSSHMALKLREGPDAQETVASLSPAFWSENEGSVPTLLQHPGAT